MIQQAVGQAGQEFRHQPEHTHEAVEELTDISTHSSEQ